MDLSEYHTSQQLDGAHHQMGVAKLLATREMDGSFWHDYLRFAALTTKAHIAIILVRSAATNSWKALAKFPERQDDLTAYANDLLTLSEKAFQEGQDQTATLSDHRAIEILPINQSVHEAEPLVLGIIKNAEGQDHPPEELLAKEILKAIPSHVQKANLTENEQLTKSLNETSLMNLTHEICEQDHILKSIFHLCNSLSNVLGCERVSFGIIKNHRIRLMAVSQSANFDPRSAVARDIVDAMEEAVDQHQPIQFPTPDEGRTICRAHRAFSESHGNRFVVTLPFEGLSETFGAVFLESKNAMIHTADIASLQRFLNAIGPFLERSHLASQWFYVRYQYHAMQAAKWLLGPQRIASKLTALSLSILLLTISLLEIDYRVDAKANVRSEDLSIIPAPFDGFLSDVYTDLGDRVLEGDLLIKLDTRELLQEESIAVADVARFRREIEKSLAARELSSMQIARAQLAQAEAKLALVQFRLSNSEIKAPRAGIIVEGDLRKDLGSPIRQGDPLLKLASTETLYLELEVSQNEIHLINEGYDGEVALVGRPEQRIPFTIERIDPVAQTRETTNVFIAKARFTSANENWWRPGMGGTAKVDSGPKTILWIVTHRTLNFLRTFFWL